MYECPYLDNPAKQLNPNKTVNPKNTTAFSRTQTVCIVFYSLPLCAMLGMETCVVVVVVLLLLMAVVWYLVVLSRLPGT